MEEFIKITKAKKEYYWYSDKIGEIFKIYRTKKTYFLVWMFKDSNHFGKVSKLDCVKL